MKRVTGKKAAKSKYVTEEFTTEGFQVEQSSIFMDQTKQSLIMQDQSHIGLYTEEQEEAKQVESLEGNQLSNILKEATRMKG